MSQAHLHLLLNHFPIIGTVLGAAMLAIAVTRKNSELAKLAFGFFTLLAGISILVYLTGGSAEEAVERLPGFSEALVERHEDAALIATIAIGSVGAVTAMLLLRFRSRLLPRPIVSAVLVAAVGVAGLMGYTANLGGQIRHTEIRSSVVPIDADATHDVSKRASTDNALGCARLSTVRVTNVGAIAEHQLRRRS